MSVISSYLLVGVDGGGTGCRVAMSDLRGKKISAASGGPANFTTDPITTVKNIRAALDKAAAKAGLRPGWQEKCVAHLGLAGVMDQADAEAVAAAMPMHQIAVTDDRATSLAGALGDQDGILVAIGTGTIVASKSGSAIRYFGGWGHHLSDQASGGWLGHCALRQTILAHDGLLEHSDLTAALLQRFEGKPDQIVHFAKGAEPGDYAEFAPLIVQAARSGDLNGLALMQRGATYLISCFEAVGLDQTDVICLAGGVGPHYEPYLDEEHRGIVQPPDGTALDGALLLARQNAKRMEETS